MGYQVKCNIELTDQRLRLDIEMDPIRWAAGNLEIKRYANSVDEGPRLKLVLGRVWFYTYKTMYKDPIVFMLLYSL